MKTKEEILKQYETFVVLSQPHNTTPIFLSENVYLAMEEYATQQLEAEREKHVKTNIQILSEATGLSIEELEFKNEVQCIRPSEALEAMKAVKANYDQDMVEFLEWADDNWMEWNTYTEALTKFRQSK